MVPEEDGPAKVIVEKPLPILAINGTAVGRTVQIIPLTNNTVITLHTKERFDCGLVCIVRDSAFL